MSPSILEAIAGMCGDVNKESGKTVFNKNELALDFLVVAHQHPEQGIWEQVLRKLGVSPAEVFRSEWNSLQQYIDEFEDEPVHKRIVTTLTSHSTFDNPRGRRPIIEKFQRYL